MGLDMLIAKIVRKEVFLWDYFNSTIIPYVLLAVIYSNLLFPHAEQPAFPSRMVRV